MVTAVVSIAGWVFIIIVASSRLSLWVDSDKGCGIYGCSGCCAVPYYGTCGYYDIDYSITSSDINSDTTWRRSMSQFCESSICESCTNTPCTSFRRLYKATGVLMTILLVLSSLDVFSQLIQLFHGDYLSSKINVVTINNFGVLRIFLIMIFSLAIIICVSVLYAHDWECDQSTPSECSGLSDWNPVQSRPDCQVDKEHSLGFGVILLAVCVLLYSSILYLAKKALLVSREDAIEQSKRVRLQEALLPEPSPLPNFSTPQVRQQSYTNYSVASHYPGVMHPTEPVFR